MKDKKVLPCLAALLLLGAAGAWATLAKAPAKAPEAQEVKIKKMKGTVTSFTATSLEVSSRRLGFMPIKKKTAFVLNRQTRKEGSLAVGAKVTVEYRVENDKNIATALKVEAAKGGG